MEVVGFEFLVNHLQRFRRRFIEQNLCYIVRGKVMFRIRADQLMYRFLDWLRHKARLRLWNATRAWGRRGEDVAHRYLRRHGYIIVARNYATRSLSGEVDLIGWDGPVLAFVEVKTRHSEEFGAPDRAIDSEKEHRLRIAARDYARHAGVDWDRVRFDVVNIVLAEPVRLTLVRDAFSTT